MIAKQKQGRKLAVATLGLSLLAAGVAAPAAYAEEAPAPATNAKNVITDKFLKACINVQLGHEKDQDVTEADLKGITELACGVSDPADKEQLVNAVQIEKLTGLEKATALTKIDLSKTQVKDLSPLKGLKALTEVKLSCSTPESAKASISHVSGYKNFRGPSADECAKVAELIPPAIPSFSDISKYPFEKEIKWFAEQRITTGYADGTFRPHEKLSRAAMAAFLYRFEGSPEYNAPITSPFIDINPSTPFYKEICWLASKRITTGYADDTFRPWENISREAMAAFLHRYDQQKGSQISVANYDVVKFSDVKNSIFKNDIQWLANTFITKGYKDGTFRPHEDIERGAIATYFHNFANVK